MMVFFFFVCGKLIGKNTHRMFNIEIVGENIKIVLHVPNQN